MKMNKLVKKINEHKYVLISGVLGGIVLNAFNIPEKIIDYYFKVPERRIAEKIIELPKSHWENNFVDYSTSINGIKYFAKVECNGNGNIYPNNLTLNVSEEKMSVDFIHRGLSGDLNNPLVKIYEGTNQLESEMLYDLEESIQNRFKKQYETFFENGFLDSLDKKVDSINVVRHKQWLADKKKWAEEDKARAEKRDSIFRKYLR